MAKPNSNGQFVGDVFTDGLEVWLWTGLDWVRGDIPEIVPPWDGGADGAPDAENHPDFDDGAHGPGEWRA